MSIGGLSSAFAPVWPSLLPRMCVNCPIKPCKGFQFHHPEPVIVKRMRRYQNVHSVRARSKSNGYNEKDFVYSI